MLSKCACCFDVSDLIVDNRMLALTKISIGCLAGFEGGTKDEIKADRSKWFYSLPL